MNDRAFYDGLWTRFASPLAMQWAIHTESRRPLLHLLTSVLPAEGTARVLEVGCGTPLVSRLLALSQERMGTSACDLSDQAVRLAEKKARELGARLGPDPDINADFAFDNPPARREAKK